MTDFPALKAALPGAVFTALVEDAPMSPKLRVVFGAGLFPVNAVSWHLDGEGFDGAMAALFAARGEFDRAECERYNAFSASSFIARGAGPPFSLSGLCAKASSPSVCKPLKDRFTCEGCGITWVPGSLKDPRCVEHPKPWWFRYIEAEVEVLIATRGGPSVTDSLVWFPWGVSRHGRTRDGRDGRDGR